MATALAQAPARAVEKTGRSLHASVTMRPELTAEINSGLPTLGGHVDSDCHPVDSSNMNPCVRDAEYAVRGAIVLRANEIAAQLRAGKQLPFDKIIYCNVGNPQTLGQKPLTFLRQVLACCDYPQLLGNPKAKEIFPKDVIDRADELLAQFSGGTGAYTDSRGNGMCRQHIAAGIEHRDGYPCNPENIFLTDGASPGVHAWLKVLIRDENDCVLTPIPQYPLYSACLKLYNGTLLPYYLDEEHNWALSVDELRSQVEKARAEGKHVRALVVINPGNPTGNVLDYDNQREIVDFCKEYGVALLADEVYQTNIYVQNKMFHSFKKVLSEAGPAYSDVLLVSFNSTSKGYFGECGRRGGYFEAVNCSEDLMAQIYKLMSINLCPNVDGQIAMSVVMHPPKAGDPSFLDWEFEMATVLRSLRDRAKLVVDRFNTLKGVKCNVTEGALYAFPRLELPQAFVDEAAKEGKPADFVYCMRLLEATGIVTVPGSGFGQKEGTWHMRTTILPPMDEIESMLDKMEKFHNDIWAKYG